MKIEEIDKNFKIESKLELNNPKLYDVKEEPFTLYGVWHDGECYRRVPKDVAEATNPGVAVLATCCAGGRIKFRTNSSYIGIKSVSECHHMSHMALIGSSGYDVYLGTNERFRGTLRPPASFDTGFESVVKLYDRKMREVTINMPSYSGVKEAYIVLEADAKVEKTRGYKREKPIVFYGSSVTQGACSTRPGTAYQCFISRALKTNFINLGFSGSAKGEDAIAEYIAGLDMSIFVYDYDYNAPSLEHFENTHERMFNIIREKNPTLPIVMMSRSRAWLYPFEVDRQKVIARTYENAIKKGDKNVYYLTGQELTKYAGYDALVDDAHPTDLGFYSMAKVLTPVLRKILAESEK